MAKDPLHNLAMDVRRQLSEHNSSANPLCCIISSATLAAVLRKIGHGPRIIDGRVRIDKPMRLEPEEPEEPVESVAHQWVEVDGFWIDLTADQFNGYVDPPYEAVRVFPARSDPRYAAVGEADPDSVMEIEREDSLLNSVLAAVVTKKEPNPTGG